MPTLPPQFPARRPTSKTDAWPSLEQLGFWNIAEREPDRSALVLPDGSTWTFGEVRREANRLAHGLRALGLKPGDSIATLLPNDTHAYTTRLAAFQTGLYITPLNHHLTGQEIAYVLGDAEARVLIADERFADTARRALAESGTIDSAHCLSIGEIEGFSELAELTRNQPDGDPPERCAGQLMLYTSGTTGRPKGVRRPLPSEDPSDWAAQRAIFARAFGLRPFDGSQLVVGPLYHAGPSVFSWGSLDAGHQQIVTDRFDPEETLRLIETHRVTNTHLVATMFHRLLALPAAVRAGYDVSSLRMVAHSAAPTPIELKRQMMDWWGPIIWETYGGTEGAATICKPHHWLAKPGTVGRPVRDARITILDEEDKPCRPGTPGRIFVEREGPKMEYWKDPEKTREIHRGNALTLGDIGYVDEDGFLFLTGRASEAIITGGVNVYPAEVENALMEHPEVVDLAVIGAPDDEWGERIVGIVQTRTLPETDSEKQALSDELLAFARERLAGFKCPREIHFRSELPREENGKLYRRRLREAFWQDSNRSI